MNVLQRMGLLISLYGITSLGVAQAPSTKLPSQTIETKKNEKARLLLRFQELKTKLSKTKKAMKPEEQEILLGYLDLRDSLERIAKNGDSKHQEKSELELRQEFEKKGAEKLQSLGLDLKTFVALMDETQKEIYEIERKVVKISSDLH